MTVQPGAVLADGAFVCVMAAVVQVQLFPHVAGIVLQCTLRYVPTASPSLHAPFTHI